MNSKSLFLFLKNGIVAGLPMLALFVIDYIPYKCGIDLYKMYTWLDILMHILGGAATAWSIHRLFSIYEKKAKLIVRPRWLFWLGLLCASMFVGVIWEWYEYLHDILFPMYTFQPSVGDTMADFLNDLVGACLFIGVLMMRGEKP